MKNDKTLARVKRERERATTLTNKSQAKKLALLSIHRADIKYESI